MTFTSKRLAYIDSSDFREAIKKQSQMKNPVNLSLGVPEELTAEHIKAAGIHAILEDKTTYTPSNGIPELRAAIVHKLQTDNNIICSPESVTIVPGLTTGQMLVYLAVLDPDDEVVVFDPYYPPYAHLATMVGARVVYVSTLSDFQPDISALESSITDKTKLIVINSPNNPSGAVYSQETLRAIATIAERYNMLVVSDEIYEDFVYDENHFSIGSIYPNTITMNGFSKSHAMTGWRLGYIAGPSDVIDAVNELQQYVVFASSSIAQYAALKALKRKPTHLLEKYKTKRDIVIKRLSRAGYHINGAQGAFYVFVKAPGNLTDIEFVDRATEHGLIVLAGRAFSQLHGFIRISYGVDMATLDKGLSILEEIANELS